MNFKDRKDIALELSKGDRLTVPEMYNIWEHRLPEIGLEKSRKDAAASVPQVRWMQEDPELVRRFMEIAYHKDEFLLVCDAYQEARASWQGRPKDDDIWMEICLYFAKARKRLSFYAEARAALEASSRNPRLDEKQRAAIHVELGENCLEESHHTEEPAERVRLAELARGYFREALTLDAAHLDAHVLDAATALILSTRGSPERAKVVELGRRVLAMVENPEQRVNAFKRTWFRAVALTVTGQTAEAFALYQKLKDCGATIAELADARYRARFLAGPAGEARNYFDDAFPPLQLVVFSGHLADRKDGPVRFPMEIVDEVRDRLRRQLDEVPACLALVSAAAGADLLFIQVLRERGIKYHVVLPWSKDEFRQTSVLPFEPGAPFWEPLFDEALAHAVSIRELGQAYEPGDAAGWEFAQEVSAGLALLTARLSRLDVQPMSLWNGLPGFGPGGTWSFVNLWQKYLRQKSSNVPLPACPPGGEAPNTFGDSRSERPTMHQEVKSILFADIVGYSKLTEKVIHDFVEVFMRKLSRLLAESRHAPRSVNTWGDAIYAVFDYADDAGRFALELIAMINDGTPEWISRGLSYEEIDPATGRPRLDAKGQPIRHPLNVRVGLHTGPVFAHYNPVLRQLGYTGSHVSRAARIEPVTTPGEVYASEEFAAMAELGKQIERRRTESSPRLADGFICEYAGTMALAKNYPGRYPIYRVVPHKTLPLGKLAEAIHELYRASERAKADDKVDKRSPSLEPWEKLSETYREANLAQAADIPNKLELLGYELAPLHGVPASELEQVIPGKLEALSMREHSRWMAEREKQKWSYGDVRDNGRKLHPSMVPWDKLPDNEKQKDRDTINNLPRLITAAGFRVRPLKRP